MVQGEFDAWQRYRKERVARSTSITIDEALAPLPLIDPRCWQDKPVPARHWLVDGLIPQRAVTLYSGDGGTGKTLTALQLIAAISLRTNWLGKDVGLGGPCLLYTAEDEEDELHRRLATIVTKSGRDLRDLEGVRLVPMAGMDPVLIESGKGGELFFTKAFSKLKELIERLTPCLVVIDPAADVFGGDEIQRKQVRKFIASLSKLALKHDCAVLLLSHPSLNGIMNKTGLSGSTAWSNSVRSRLYIETVKDQPNRRILSVQKANYGPTGEQIKLKWDDGVYVLDSGEDPVVTNLLNRKADDVFIATFTKLSTQGIRLSPNKSSAYAPKLISKHPDAKGYTSQKLAEAMGRLLDARALRIETVGPPSRSRDVLSLASSN